MVWLGALVLLVALFLALGYPFFRRPRPEEGEGENSPRQELVGRREAAYAALQELEFDLASGTLSREDYLDLESRYKSRALSTLKELDEMEQGSGLEQEIEREVGALRRQGKGPEVEIEREIKALRGQGKGPEEEIEAQVQKLRRPQFCSQCGASIQPGAKFCSQCGARL